MYGDDPILFAESEKKIQIEKHTLCKMCRDYI